MGWGLRKSPFCGGGTVYGYFLELHNIRKEYAIAIERLSLTFTANGKRQTFAVCIQLSVQ